MMLKFLLSGNKILDVSHLASENVYIFAEYDTCTSMMFYNLMALRAICRFCKEATEGHSKAVKVSSILCIFI